MSSAKIVSQIFLEAAPSQRRRPLSEDPRAHGHLERPDGATDGRQARWVMGTGRPLASQLDDRRRCPLDQILRGRRRRASFGTRVGGTCGSHHFGQYAALCAVAALMTMLMFQCRDLRGPRCCGCIQLVHCAGLFHGPACQGGLQLVLHERVSVAACSPWHGHEGAYVQSSWRLVRVPIGGQRVASSAA